MKDTKEGLKKIFEPYILFTKDGKVIPLLESELGKELFDEVAQFQSPQPAEEAISIVDVLNFLEYYNELSPAQKCTVHPPAGSGGSNGIYNLSIQEIFKDWCVKSNISYHSAPSGRGVLERFMGWYNGNTKGRWININDINTFLEGKN